MSTNSNFDRIAEAWLAEGPTQLADRVLDAALDEVHLTRQRRRLPALWRFNPMPTSVRLVAAAVIGVLAVGLLYLNLPGRNDVGGPSPTINPLLNTATWTAFTSPRYGFSAKYPASFAAVPSELAWRMPNASGNMFDGFHDDGAVKWLNGISTLLPVGASRDDWYDEYRRDLVEDEVAWEPESCFTPREDWSSTTVDGLAADLRMSCAGLEAFVFVADRVYMFGAYAYDGVTPPTLEPGVSDELRDLFELWLTTITLDPTSALYPTPVPTPGST